MKKIIFVIGGAATGKTTFIKRRFSDKTAGIFNVWDYQCREYGDEECMSGWRKLFRANEELLNDILKFAEKSDSDIIVEHTLFMAKRRIAYIDEIRKATDAEIEFYVMQPSDGQWESNIRARGLRDGLNRYKSEMDVFEFPNSAEGIDAIYEVKDGNIIAPRKDAPKPEITEPARKALREEKERILKEDEERQRRRECTEIMNTRPFWHYCEVCGKKEFITAKEAYESGWDYPPNMGVFGKLSPRTCGDCTMDDTLFMKFMKSGLMRISELTLTEDERITLERIRNEPESLLDDNDSLGKNNK